MTVPQMLMLNHASWVNGKRLDSKSGSTQQDKGTPEDPYVTEFGKRFSELNADELNHYYRNW
jgi:hypothetical protein